MKIETTREEWGKSGAVNHSRAYVLGASLASFGAVLGHAQEANEREVKELDEITVTAKKEKKFKPETVSSPKYQAPLRDTPRTVTVVPKEIMEEQGARTLTDVLRNVPGISIQAGEGGGASNSAGDMFTMRGFDASSSLFRDGLRDSGLVSRDTFNTENVEAFVGPGGADVGRGTAAGYVNTQTKTPQLEDFFKAATEVHTAGRYRQTVDVNRKLDDAKLPAWMAGTAMRLNLMGENGAVAGRDEVEREKAGLGAAVATGLGTGSRFTLFSQHVRENNIPDYGIPAKLGRELPGTSSDWYYGSSKSNHEDIKQDMITAIYENELTERLTLRNVSRFARTHRDAVITAPGYNSTTNLITRSLQANERTNETFTNATSANFIIEHGAMKHTLTAALELSTEEQESHTGSQTLATSVVGVKPTNFAAARPAATTNSVGESDTVSLSLFDHWELGSKWLIDAGIRMDRYDTKYHATSPVSATNPDGLVDEEIRDTLYSGKIGFTYKPVEQGSLYLAYGSTVTPPGSANFNLSEATTSQENPNVDLQESRSLEAGIKWDVLDESLSLAAAVFRTENTNVLYNDDTTGTYYSDGGQVVEGVTLSATGQITDQWAVFANATWLDASVDQPGDQYDGNWLVRTPEFSASLWTTYQVAEKWTIGGGVRYQGESMANSANTVTVPGYAVFDAMLQYEHSEHLTFRLNAYNLLDRDYISSINNNTQRLSKGEPASLMLTTQFSF